jgi:ATP-dependent DNA ligase
VSKSSHLAHRCFGWASLIKAEAFSFCRLPAIHPAQHQRVYANPPADLVLIARSAGLEKSHNARFIKPMECLPVEKIPEGDNWTYELKLDGYRLAARV